MGNVFPQSKDHIILQEAFSDKIEGIQLERIEYQVIMIGTEDDDRVRFLFIDFVCQEKTIDFRHVDIQDI